MTENKIIDERVEVEEVNLEDLIILGEDKKIPIIIEFPKSDGEIVKAQALVKQITLRELDDIKESENDLINVNVVILEKSLLKQNGSHFNREEIMSMPIGVVNAIAEKIMELSGVTENMSQKIKDF